MRRSASLSLAAAILLAVPAMAHAQAAATTAPAAPVAPEVGQAAPRFTATWVDAATGTGSPMSLDSLRGKVVVLAFYPKDRTSGCTAELTKFRDEHAKLFGSDVVVLPVSADSVASHVSWGTEMKFPFGLVSDPSLALAEQYGSRMPGRPYAARTVFVIGKDGRITYREMKFNALNEDAYTQLAAAVAKAR
jgi:peroxiredoxin Q/BCP